MFNSVPSFVLIGLFILIWLLLSLLSIMKIVRILVTPTQSIGSLPTNGLVKVTGKAGGKIIKSPITQTDCVFWKIEVEKKYKGRAGDVWDTVFKKISEEAFHINDGTGRVLILPNPKSEIVLNSDLQLLNGAEKFGTQIQETLLNLGMKKYYSEAGHIFLPNTLRVTEKLISSGEQVYVNGPVKCENGMNTIGTEKGVALLISDQDEKVVLGKLYWRVAGMGILILLIGFFIFLFR